MSRKLRHRSHHGQHHEEAAPDHATEVETLAYRLWEERGSPLGSPEEDWFKAEEHLQKDEEAASRL